MAELCSMLQVSKPTIYKWIKFGKLEPDKTEPKVIMLVCRSSSGKALPGLTDLKKIKPTNAKNGRLPRRIPFFTVFIPAGLNLMLIIVMMDVPLPVLTVKRLKNNVNLLSIGDRVQLNKYCNQG